MKSELYMIKAKSIASASIIVFSSLLLFVNNYKFSEAFNFKINYFEKIAGFGSGKGAGLPEVNLPKNTYYSNNSDELYFTQNCFDEDLEMFIGLSKSSLINFGYPAGSLVLNVGKKPSHSKYGKRIVLEIGENGKVAKAYCY